MSVDALLATLAASREAAYIGEPISQLEHALQCAALARATGDDELVAAALLHDLGHLDTDAGEALRGEGGHVLGVERHEQISEARLRKAGLGERVARLAGAHVEAKRYLATKRPGYLGKLSDASRQTLALQGGPMSDAEAAAFERQADHAAMLKLRAYDEGAKVPGAEVPELESYRALLEGLVAEEQRRREAVLAPLDRRLTAEELQAWRHDHLLVLPGIFEGAALATLDAWVSDLASRPERAGMWMKYFEATSRDDRQLCRVEDFVPHHAGMAQLLESGPLLRMLGELMGEPAVLYKEKVNFKLPGGAGFRPHQDAPAFATFGQRYHVTVLVTIDPSRPDNGGLEFTDPVPEGTTLAQEPDGTLSRALEAELPWRPLDLPAGSLAFFDSYIPHRSHDNASTEPRRSLYVTYNRERDGNRRADYYADKRRSFPPEIERQPGVTYTGGSYNLGNPIR